MRNAKLLLLTALLAVPGLAQMDPTGEWAPQFDEDFLERIPGPDIGDYLKQLDVKEVVIAPIGFLSDHMEVIYDLDTEARRLCESLGIRMVRAATVGVHPEFVSMIRDLVLERTEGAPRLAVGDQGFEVGGHAFTRIVLPRSTRYRLKPGRGSAGI